MTNLAKILAVFIVSTMLTSPVLADDKRNVAWHSEYSFATGFGFTVSFNVYKGSYGAICGRSGVRGFALYSMKTALPVFLSVPAIIDWHPSSSSGFRISAGFAFNFNNHLNIVQKEAEDFFFQVPIRYKPSNFVSPIVSVGYDGSFIDNAYKKYSFELGLMYGGDINFSSGIFKFDGRVKQALLDHYNNSFWGKLMKYTPIIKVGIKYEL